MRWTGEVARCDGVTVTIRRIKSGQKWLGMRTGLPLGSDVPSVRSACLAGSPFRGVTGQEHLIEGWRYDEVLP